MDPNEALRLIRANIAQMRVEDTPVGGIGTSPTFVQHARDLAETIEGLDEWLSKDGFLPSDWQSDDEKAEPGFNDRNALIVAALRELPWGEDVDINGGDLVDLVGQLLLADGRDALTALRERAKEQFNEEEYVTPPPRAGDSCQFGPTMGLITHRRWGGPGDCDEHEHGVITDGATGKVVGRLGEGEFA